MGDEEEEGALGATRYPVMPSLVALQTMRNRLHLAYLGKKLMKWTALATGKELRRLSLEMAVLMKDYGVKMQTAFILLARARYFVHGMNEMVLETVPNLACVTVTSTKRSVSGVKVKNLHVQEMGCDSYQYMGMSKGGTAVKECKEAWLELVKMMVMLCQYRITFELVDDAHKNATKKQNVLSRCIIPRIIITMRYILSELDEMEREESFRLKRFKQLKYKNVQETTKEVLETEEEADEKPKPEPKPQPKVALKPEPKPKPVPVPEPKVEPKPKPVPVPEPKIEPKPIPIVARQPEPIPEPIIVPEPPVIDPLELLMTHITEVVRLAEQLETEPTPKKDIGLTICELGRLKVQLKKVIEVSEGPNKDRVCTKCEKIGITVSSCSCQTKLETPKPVQTGDFKTQSKPEISIDLKPRFKEKTPIPEYILKPRLPPPPPSPLAAPKPLDLQAMSNNRIEQLEKHVDEVICMTNHYQCEGLLTKSAENFLKCCKSVKIKIQEFKCHKIVKTKLDRLKEQVTNLEKITNIVQKRDLSATTVSSFMSCCKEFRDKIDILKSCRGGSPTVSSIEKLLKRIDYSIALSKEAKEKGLVSESVEEFIKSCVEIKSKIEPHNEPKPQVIDDLILNLNDILDCISKYKDGALVSDSIETFYKNCQTTKAKLDTYKAPPPQPGCGKSTCPKTPPIITPPPGCGKSTCSKTPPIKTPPPESASCPCTKASSHTPSVYSCSAGASVPSEQVTTSTCSQNVGKLNACSAGSSFPSEQVTTSTCCQSTGKQQSQNTYKSESNQGSAPPLNEITCVHKRPSPHSCKSCQSVPSIKFKPAESGSNVCGATSKSNSSVKIIVVPKERKKMEGPNASKTESITTTVKIYKKIDGDIVAETETVTVREYVYDPEQRLVSKTSSCASCGSGKSTKRVNLCKVPVMKGFIQTVRNIKSETLIRTLDLSTTYPPFFGSSASAYTLSSLEWSHKHETSEQDPFFCASPTTDEEDSVILM